MPLGINDVSHYYCNVIHEIWLNVSIQDEDSVYCFIILGCGPADYNAPLKGHRLHFQSHYSCDSKWIWGMYADPSATVWGVEMA